VSEYISGQFLTVLTDKLMLIEPQVPQITKLDIAQWSFILAVLSDAIQDMYVG